MNYLELKYKGKTYKNTKQILGILKEEHLHWLIDSEVSNAIIEITNNTLIWHEGTFMSGNWHYGIFKNGKFYGNWENGIFENGFFSGKWKSGINLSKNN